jgi:hypothetical protein
MTREGCGWPAWRPAEPDHPHFLSSHSEEPAPASVSKDEANEVAASASRFETARKRLVTIRKSQVSALL